MGNLEKKVRDAPWPDVHRKGRSGVKPWIQERRLTMTTPQHCPGFEQIRNLKSFVCKCPNCGKEKEIFSDEFDQKHRCPVEARKLTSQNAL
jgi:hypothetical protein